ncbi:uncharacterized protein [Drosophila virilis]|uniref:Uncharacterized protein n=1 Tax=Drosophila virilis TaxID=7244 RepID=B4M7Q4_DROVI|nr:uncharacterized protein LOC6633452 [Drosophila virilis]EDW62821.1 uncharacterized protein Dvir_GJ16406 [Drosophila virilis]
MADHQQQQQQQEQEPQQTPASGTRQRQRRRSPPPMPSDDVMRNTIARCLTQIVVNMQNADIQQRCRELLQVEDLTQGAHIRILAALEQIDGQREQRERAANERRQRRANKSI